jgi:hypothetical protein
VKFRQAKQKAVAGQGSIFEADFFSNRSWQWLGVTPREA